MIDDGCPPDFGVVEWFRIGERERVERVLRDLSRLNIRRLRTGLSWADYHTDEGPNWYAWLLPRLAAEIDVLPCITYTPPSLGVEPKSCAPPRNPKDYADFVDLAIDRHGDCFDHVEFWNEPNNLNDWDWRLDPDWSIFREMISMAAHWARRCGKRTVLGGMCPTDPQWLDLLARSGALADIDAVGVHGFPGTWEYDWNEWSEPVSTVRDVLERLGVDAEIWVTEAGYSSWRNDEFAQVAACADLLRAPVDRTYWYSAHDLNPLESHQEGFHADERHYHFGLFHHDGRDKLLSRVWSTGGWNAVVQMASLGRAHAATIHLRGARSALKPVHNGRLNGHAHHAPVNGRSVRAGSEDRFTLVTGGAGFIGTNLCDRLLGSGRRVRLFDNLARPGVEDNLRWLCSRHGSRLEVQLEDVRDRWAVAAAVRGADQIFHFASQVAVTSSVDDPRLDFDVNAAGTFNVLEAARALEDPPPLLFTSTNKVYGALDDVELMLREKAYVPVDPQHRQGIGTDRRLDFESPYGCSKGAADQYVLEYARLYGLPALVFRMSCIYGPHQCGTEDQGWVAHFVRCALSGTPITIYGDGCQVRDVLFVDDVVDAMLTAMNHISRVCGRAFNIGGGPERAVSLLQIIDMLRDVAGVQPDVTFEDWRPSDQRYYVSDTSAFHDATGWRPNVGARQGLEQLYAWLQDAHSVGHLQSSY